MPTYQIPLRSLIARDGKNLRMAGRSLSADQLALSSARVSTSAAMMGQAAGIAAALAARKACDPRDLDPADVRRVVIERGAELEVGELVQKLAGTYREEVGRKMGGRKMGRPSTYFSVPVSHSNARYRPPATPSASWRRRGNRVDCAA
ncbi:MAG: FAD-dependent oxidoreductase [Pirellulaceae bacterium]|nr:FAD-dependent oxidoreductase [Pirellulaceae bacterium]